jgi:hypothetical protein
MPEYLRVAFRIEILEKSLASVIDALRRVERGDSSATNAKTVADACAAILDGIWMEAKEAVR